MGKTVDADANSTIERHFKLAADRVEPALRWAAGSPAEHAGWRRAFSRRLKRLVGEQPERVPLEVRWDEVADLGTVVRRKIYVRSEDNYWVPAYYFVPKQVRDRTPAILCLHGHSGILPYIREGDAAQRRKCREGDLDYAVHLAEHGYVTLAAVQRGWNETALPEDRARGTRSCHRVITDAFLLGMTPVGQRCWDASRLVDFLETQEPVDRERIGVAGLSGGGTTGLFLTALEPRIGLAMIGGYYCTFRDSIFSIYHCICNCVPDLMRWARCARSRPCSRPAAADHSGHPRRDLSNRGHQASLPGAGRSLRVARRVDEPRPRFLRRPARLEPPQDGAVPAPPLGPAVTGSANGFRIGRYPAACLDNSSLTAGTSSLRISITVCVLYAKDSSSSATACSSV